MTTYFITFANIFEAAAFKEFLDSYKRININYFNYRSCSISANPDISYIAAAFNTNVLSKDSTVKYKQVRKGITRYPILKF